MKPVIQSLKGTRDFYPEDMAVRTWLYQKIRNVSESFGYQEYEGPFLESINLYAAKSGEELVKEQSFVFPDRSGELITLRPELTPTLARMVAQRQRQLIYPLRWWSFGPFWRYERPQKGRSREFFQWNIDLIGVDSPQADAELIAIIAFLFKSLDLVADTVKIAINDRQLMEAELEGLNFPRENLAAIFRLVDRKGKMQPDEWDRYALESGVTSQQLTRLHALLARTDLWEKSNNLRQVFQDVEAFGIADYVSYDPAIIRGLDYYTGTVFEAFEIKGDIRRSILGGGRYDNLLADVGGDALPAVGFAMGDVVLGLILKNNGCIPADINKNPARVLVTIFDESLITASIALSTSLRIAGIPTMLYPQPGSLGKQFKYADRIGIPLAVVLGPDEVRNDQVSIKNLTTGEQITIPQSELIEHLSKML